MIICTVHTLKIGQRVYGPVTDVNLAWHTVPFVVLRAATEDEYRAHAESFGVTPHPFTEPTNFYTVSMD